MRQYEFINLPFIMKYTLPVLLKEIKSCKTCEEYLDNGVNPVVTAATESRIIIIGQAPGSKVHASSIPWSDASGKRLREWMGVDEEVFYDTKKNAVIPMGFCYPGKGKSGDLPPRKECAPQWHPPLMELLPNVQLILLVGSYAQKYYLGKTMKKNLTETVGAFEEYLPKYFPIPHPSPLNGRWLKRNYWFEEQVVPQLKATIKKILHEI